MSKRSSAAKASVTVEKAVPKFCFVIVNRATFPLLPFLPYKSPAAGSEAPPGPRRSGQLLTELASLLSTLWHSSDLR